MNDRHYTRTYDHVQAKATSDGDSVGNNLPFFKFPVHHWLEDRDIRKMTATQRGYLIQLLAEYWANGLSTDLHELAWLAGARDVDDFNANGGQVVLQQFECDGERLRHSFLDQNLAECEAVSDRSRQAGKKSWLPSSKRFKSKQGVSMASLPKQCPSTERVEQANCYGSAVADREQCSGSSTKNESEIKKRNEKEDETEIENKKKTQSQKPEDIPEGLELFQYASALLEMLVLPSSKTLLGIVASSIQALAKSKGISFAETAVEIRDRAKRHRAEGASIDRFWFENGTFASDEIRRGGRKSSARSETDRIGSERAESGGRYSGAVGVEDLL